MSRALQGLAIRIARALNRLWGRKGRVFADRYHDRILRTPREVRNALVYVLKNHVKHGVRLVGLDPFASGTWFEGWKDALGTVERALHLASAKTWLSRTGWRKGGLIGLADAPRSIG